MRTRITSLLLFATVFLAAPAYAEFWAVSNFDLVVDKNTDVSPPQYWLKGFTFPEYEIPGSMLVVGQSTGVVNVDDEQGRRDITLADNFELNDFAPRNGAAPPEIRTVNLGGSPTWQDTNGDKFDFFIFEAGANDEFAVQAILPGGVLGQKVVVPAGTWKATDPEPLPDLKRTPGPNNNQQIAGIAFKVTDLLDENGQPLTNASVIEGLVFTSPGMDPSCICAVKGTPFAAGPTPADDATLDTVCTLLQWSPGTGALSEEVYFSANSEEVTDMAASALLATVTMPAANVCAPGTPYADGLAPGIYYWRVVSIDAAQDRGAGPVWSFTVISGSAFDPSPVDAAIYVDPENVVLSWTPGADAIIHYVFLGTDADEVANATEGTPTAETSFTPTALEKGKTYYWRIDEFSGTGTTAGEIWSFSTMPSGEGGLKAEYFSSEEPLLGEPVVTRVDSQVDFNWNQDPPDPALDRLLFSARWKGEIKIPAAGTYTFITRSNDGSRIYVNDQLVVQDWSTHVVRDAMGTITLAAGTYPIAVEYFQQGGSAEMHILWRSNLIPQQIVPSVALIPAVRARLVAPADKAVNVSQSPRLLWEASAPEARHDVYLGEDMTAVEQADTASSLYQGRQDETSYVAELEPGKAYYWRIDEVIAGDPQSPVTGRVWSFTVAEFIVVDDFENYTDDFDAGQAIWQGWTDGLTNDTGSIVGYFEAPFAEQTIVRGGRQSMPLEYSNAETPYYSETEHAFDPPHDWTGDPDALAISFRGIAPMGSFGYDAAKDQYTVTATGNGIDGAADSFRFVYKKLTGDGTITARIESMGHPNDWAVAGVMIRETLEPGSPMAISGVRATGQAILRWRGIMGDTVGTVEEPPFPATIVIPHYIRLTRQGSTLRADHSSDGTTWEPIGESVSISIGQQVYIGLAVTANVADPQTTSTAVFSNVSTVGTLDAAGPFQTVTDIGMAGNSPQRFYVAVQDTAGQTAVVAHPDGPDAIVTNAWTEWLIDLEDIAGQGVNLGAVGSLVIGVGNRAGGAPDGAGMLYIDDIRLLGASILPPVITVAPVDSIEVTGDDGMVLSINGIDVSNLILGTTTTDFEKYADHPAAHADDLDLGTYASLDDSNFINMVFTSPVTTIFIVEPSGNDQGFIQPLDAAGTPVGRLQAYANSDWHKPGAKINNQAAGASVITSEVPISGIRILPPAGGAMGLDPASVSGVPAP